jgi:hypothetical protein
MGFSPCCLTKRRWVAATESSRWMARRSEQTELFFTMPEKTRTAGVSPAIFREIRPHGLSSLNRKSDLPNSH